MADEMSGAKQVAGTLGEASAAEDVSTDARRDAAGKPSGTAAKSLTGADSTGVNAGEGRPAASVDKGAPAEIRTAGPPAGAVSQHAPDTAQADTPNRSASGGADRQPTLALDAVRNIPVTLTVVLGSISVPVSSLMNMQRGETIELKKRVGEPVDVLANGKLIGRGEIVVLEEDEPVFAVSLTELATSGPGSSASSK